ncbi:hypothetical protein L596_025725 [Steinernema carpocapsae]|uniref:Uncharacterized protein n=1 Tax=Steinernema carpocapsae TaxID=34508 RepID=A0A4U5M8N1_STECR|nr:hypothetical protein L596_025725 [Steinernema carpocapsae]
MHRVIKDMRRKELELRRNRKRQVNGPQGDNDKKNTSTKHTSHTPFECSRLGDPLCQAIFALMHSTTRKTHV